MSQPLPIVYVVDDDISVRESLESLIRFSGWNPMVFETAKDFLAEPRPDVPCCLILDVYLPDLNGLDLQNKIASSRTDMPIIFISGQGDIPTTVKAMKGGAIEFLPKPFGDEILLSTIRHAIMRSQAVLDGEEDTRELRKNYASLSSREREVMALVTTGLMNKQIGGKLGISEITVKAHRGRVMRKMKATSLADLIGMVARLR